MFDLRVPNFYVSENTNPGVTLVLAGDQVEPIPVNPVA